MEWKYVSTKENSEDLGCRGCEICTLDNKRWEGPKWLQDQTPEHPKIENFEEPEIEKKRIKEILATTFTRQKSCLLSCYQNSCFLKH